jgi:hypothetical protein
MTRPSVMKETIRITPWQRGQTSGSISYTRLRSWAQLRRRAADDGGAQAGGGGEWASGPEASGPAC